MIQMNLMKKSKKAAAIPLGSIFSNMFHPKNEELKSNTKVNQQKR